ncbi:MAG: molybdenum cofactor biosynthesis protein MoaE [Desulfurococcales archaeon]|nr:molybdenum cofactor biosynthesis protein MoaE [Desulfurococcales archaeon]
MPEVTLRLYSILRDAFGSGEVKINVEGDYTIRRIVEELSKTNQRLKAALDAIGWELMVVVDGKPSDLDDKVGDAKTIHLMPPPAGGNRIIKVGVLGKEHRIDFNKLIEELGKTSRRVGAVGLFVGVVRGVNQGEEVLSLDYEHAGEIADDVLRRIAEEEAERHDLDGVAIYHYTGTLNPGELTIVVAVAGESRKNIYPALESLVERVKHEAPIWKLEYRGGGKRVYILGDKYIDASLTQERKVTHG